MPAWIKQRKDRILSKNPDMKEEVAWAIATQQAHKLGKTPKGYGTAEGKKGAREKYRGPLKDYRKTAMLKTGSAVCHAMSRELLARGKKPEDSCE